MKPKLFYSLISDILYSNCTYCFSVHSHILPEIVIAVVSCGMRLQETLNMLKSAIIFDLERIPIKFVIVTETNLMTSFKEKVSSLLFENVFFYCLHCFLYNSLRIG